LGICTKPTSFQHFPDIFLSKNGSAGIVVVSSVKFDSKFHAAQTNATQVMPANASLLPASPALGLPHLPMTAVLTVNFAALMTGTAAVL
jgi:hypothetical protein